MDERAGVAVVLAHLGEQALKVAEPDEVLRLALAAAVDVLHAEVGTAARRQSDGRLVVAADIGPVQAAVDARVPLTVEDSFVAAVMSTGRPLAGPDLRADPRLRPTERMLECGVVGGVAVPLLRSQEPVGVLAVYSRRVRRFTAGEVTVLQAIATIAVTAWDQVEYRERLSHQALHDPLTGLPNRALLLDRLEHALSRRPTNRAGPAPATAVALIDLDQFKGVNDGLGHAAGDAVLHEVGRRLAAAVRAEDTVARFGGDEFALLCTAVPDEKVAVGVARRLSAACARPLTVGSTVITVTASVGISMTTAGQGHAATVESLLREADTALYRAKRHGGARVELFDVPMQEQERARQRLEMELRGAIEGDQLFLLYQPIRATGDRRVVGVEALLRWRHPDRGILLAADFLPLAESSGLIVPIGRWALRTACAQAAVWQREPSRHGLADLRVAVNVSARQLEDPELVADVAAGIETTGLRPGTLTLELTENALLSGGEATQDVLRRLASAGAALSVDDFGAGYSSLTQLAGLPLQALKIDRSFVAGLGRDRVDTVVVSAAIALAAELGVSVVAQGVQTERQFAALRRLNCPAVQGPLLDSPAPQPNWEPPLLTGSDPVADPRQDAPTGTKDAR